MGRIPEHLLGTSWAVYEVVYRMDALSSFQYVMVEYIYISLRNIIQKYVNTTPIWVTFEELCSPVVSGDKQCLPSIAKLRWFNSRLRQMFLQLAWNILGLFLKLYAVWMRLIECGYYIVFCSFKENFSRISKII